MTGSRLLYYDLFDLYNGGCFIAGIPAFRN